MGVTDENLPVLVIGMNDESSESKYRWARVVGQCSFIPIYLALFPVAFRYIGVWLDGWLGTSFLGITFLFLGLFSGFRQTYFVIKNLIDTLE